MSIDGKESRQRSATSLLAPAMQPTTSGGNIGDLVAQLSTGAIIVDLSSALRQLSVQEMNVFSNSGGARDLFASKNSAL